MRLQHLIGKPDGKKNVLFRIGGNADIISVVQRSFPVSVDQTRKIAYLFRGKNRTETAQNIWNYLRNSIQYKADPVTSQLVRMPKRFVWDGTGDCKSFSTFAAGVLANLGMPVAYRYASYDPNDPRPSHVYVVTRDEQGRQIIVDGVYKHFNREAPYSSIKDYKMEVGTLSGLPGIQARNLVNGTPVRQLSYADRLRLALRRGESKMQPGVVAVIQNEIARIEGRKQSTADQHYANRVRSLANTWKGRGVVWVAIQNELKRIAPYTNYHGTPQTVGELEIGKIRLGKFLKRVGKQISINNVKKALATVALLPARKAFLALVAVNARGLATRLRNAKKRGEILSKWAGFGGKKSVLESAINKGAKRKPLFGSKKIIKGINGEIHVIDMDHAIGFDPAAIATIIAAATPILVAIIGSLKGEPLVSPDGKLVPDGTSGILDIAQEALGSGGREVLDNVQGYLNGSAQTAMATGEAPNYPATPAERTAVDELPSESSFTVNPYLIGGAALIAVLALSKK